MIKPNYEIVETPAPEPFLRTAKRIVLKAANRIGVSSAVGASRWRQQRLLVLCYHGISQVDEHEWSSLYISPERLERRMEVLRKSGTTVLPLDKAVDALYNHELPQQAVAITFDDGACDFAIKAAPILSAANMHSTLYLTTYYCGKDMPVFAPFVSYLLWKGRGRTVLLPGLYTRVTIPQFVDTPEFDKLHRSLLQHAEDVRMDAVEKNEFARLIARAVGVDFDALNEKRIMHLMTPEEVRSLDPNLVDIQLHTHRHRTPQSQAELHEELTRNADEIRRMTGRSTPLTHFCYPSGRYHPDLVTWLRMSGMRSATTCKPNYSSEDTSPLEIPRFIDTMPITEDTFEAWVRGSAAFTLRR